MKLRYIIHLKCSSIKKTKECREKYLHYPGDSAKNLLHFKSEVEGFSRFDFFSQL